MKVNDYFNSHNFYILTTNKTLTWRVVNKTLTWRVVKECLGRAMANPKWLELFSEAYLINLVASIFYHTHLLLCSDCGQSHVFNKRFWFEKAWLAKKDLPDVVKAGWEKEEGGNFLSKVNSCVSELSHWGRRLSLGFRAKISRYKADLERLWYYQDKESIDEFNKVKSQLKGFSPRGNVLETAG